MVYSLLGSCKLQGINAHEYVQDVLQRLPDHPINQLKELLPPFWKKSNISPVPEI
ncbi:transposase domain-containing protein [Rhodocytophaga aerolata]|uniref:transposase domain-containing protein n=1 Tax=Rhodocytophaga aerolata TaxID=455078 RepID=UPI003608CB3E